MGISGVANKAIGVVESFLSITCKPALAELGNMAGDKVRVWRLNNVIKILEKSKNKFEFRDNAIQLKANPKVALAIIENGANEESEELQEMWAGLFNSALSETGENDEVILYVNILKQLSIAEARLLRYMCENSKKGVQESGLATAQTVTLYSEQITEITGINDSTHLEAILNHLNSLRLNEKPQSLSNFSFRVTENKKLLAWLSPTSLALSLYVRCQGYKGSVADYWKLRSWVEIREEEERNKSNPKI